MDVRATRHASRMLILRLNNAERHWTADSAVPQLALGLWCRLFLPLIAATRERPPPNGPIVACPLGICRLSVVIRLRFPATKTRKAPDWRSGAFHSRCRSVASERESIRTGACHRSMPCRWSSFPSSLQPCRPPALLRAFLLACLPSFRLSSLPASSLRVSRPFRASA